jgi:hypothetical protein
MAAADGERAAPEPAGESHLEVQAEETPVDEVELLGLRELEAAHCTRQDSTRHTAYPGSSYLI